MAAMRFLPTPEGPDPRPAREGPLWGRLLFLAAALTVVATRAPWLRVKFERLFGAHSGPPGWESPAGFTCLCTSMMVAMMALIESGTRESQQAVRPGSLLLTGIALLTLLLAAVQGPGDLRSVSASWTGWFYLACASTPLLCYATFVRWRHCQPARS